MFYAQAAACHTTIRIILGTGVVHTAYVQHAKHFNKWQRVRIFDGWRAVGPPIYEARPAIRSEPLARQLSRVYTTAQRESDPFPIWIDIALHDIHIFRRLTNCCWLLQGVADREHQQPRASSSTAVKDATTPSPSKVISMLRTGSTRRYNPCTDLPDRRKHVDRRLNRQSTCCGDSKKE